MLSRKQTHCVQSMRMNTINRIIKVLSWLLELTIKITRWKAICQRSARATYTYGHHGSCWHLSHLFLSQRVWFCWKKKRKIFIFKNGQRQRNGTENNKMKLNRSKTLQPTWRHWQAGTRKWNALCSVFSDRSFVKICFYSVSIHFVFFRECAYVYTCATTQFI